ncbi:MAG: lipoyl(octanoyl) transferase LipB [Thermoplasmata archaeon]
MKERCAVLDLGTRDYGETWELQKRLVAQRLEGQALDTLLLVEHPAVYTVGRRGGSEGIENSPLPVYEVERGGEATYHGPGQLVGYPIMALPKGKLGIKAFIEALEEVLIRTVGDAGIPGERGIHAGLWVGPKKLASIGVAVKHHVTYHGFALNVNIDLEPFLRISPCGLDGSTLTSMSKVLGRNVDMEAVKPSLLLHFGDVFDRDLTPSPRTLTTPLRS